MILSRPAVRPADYYSGPSPAAVLPRGVTFGCGAASVGVLLLVFAGGAYLSGGGIIDLMDLVLGMSMGDVRGMYTQDVTTAQKKELEAAIEAVRERLRQKKLAVADLDPVLQTMRKAIADGKMQPAEVQALAAAARKAAR